MPDRVDVLLVGGGVAAVRCARTLRRERFDGSIVLLGAEARLPYNRPPLSKELLRDDLPDDLVAAEPEAWYARRGIELRSGVEVVGIDPDAGLATLDDGSTVGFGRCLLATGAAPRRLDVPGGQEARLLRTLPDARALRAAAVAAGAGAPVVIVGGGFIGVEVGSSLATLGVSVTVVELGDRLWSGTLGERLHRWAVDRLAEIGVQVRTGGAITRVDPDAAWLAAERLPAAFVVAGIGVEPLVGLAADAGLEVADGIVTDAGQRTSHPAVWAAGDVARAAGNRVEHWHAAREAGERAALSMLGRPVPAIPVPWLFSEVAGITIDVVGAARRWDEELELRGGQVVAFVEGDRVVQLAVIGSALPADRARALVADGASVGDVERALAGSA